MLPAVIVNSKRLIGGKLLSEWGQLFLDYMQSIDHHFDPGHKIDHVLRVTQSAISIAEQEGADLAIVLPAVMLHDTKPIDKFHQDRAKASVLSGDNAIELLISWDYPAEYHQAIQHAIVAHSFSAGIKAETLEAKVVQDADRLDALGAIGIARTIAIGSKHGNPLYHAAEPFPINREPNDNANIVDHFYVKLFRLPESLHTTAAKLIATRRIAVMQDYLQALAEEIGVTDFRKEVSAQ